MIDLIVFSKDRPLQLYAFLESLHGLTDAKTIGNVHVIHRYADENRQYLREIERTFDGVRFVEQSDIKNDVLNILRTSPNDYCSFFVDDIVFKLENSFMSILLFLFSNDNILKFSLRMGLNLNHCYPTNSRQPIPSGRVEDDVFIWNYVGASGDWGYKISLDGDVFKKESVIKWSEPLEFGSPNQYESCLQSVGTAVTDCACFVKSTIVNLPMSCVQNEYKNRNAGMSNEMLLQSWREGKKIDIAALYGIANPSAHYLAPFYLVDRRATACENE
jgi:hypothetical protein